WDAVPGFYEVQASKPGCGTTTTAAFEIPPAVEDLQLVLHCTAGLLIETESLPDATRGAAYSVQLVAANGVAPYKWKKTAALPKGLKLSKSGLLSGTPKTKLAPGSYSVKVLVTDASKKPKHTGSRTLTLQIS
ncbi:MAG: Ig family protein, partial [Solirubrobacterales bacterium]|nr:Ig family protein [Solirubrobacterales bacterium]